MATIHGFDHINLKPTQVANVQTRANLPTYQSRSKGTVVIRDMHTKHIINAIRSQIIKQTAELLQKCDSVDAMGSAMYRFTLDYFMRINPVIKQLHDELVDRGEA